MTGRKPEGHGNSAPVETHSPLTSHALIKHGPLTEIHTRFGAGVPTQVPSPLHISLSVHDRPSSQGVSAATGMAIHSPPVALQRGIQQPACGSSAQNPDSVNAEQSLSGLEHFPESTSQIFSVQGISPPISQHAVLFGQAKHSHVTGSNVRPGQSVRYSVRSHISQNSPVQGY